MHNLRISLVCFLLSGALSACVSEEEPQAGRADLALSHGSEDPVALVEIGLDSASYAGVVDRLGTEPDGIVDLGPSAAPLVRVELSPGTPTTLFVDSVHAVEGRGPVPTDLELSIGTDGHAIGLLLPAVQNLTSLGTDTDANGTPTLFLTMETETPIVTDLQAPPQAIDSFFDISYDLVGTASALPGATPEERALVDSLPHPVPVKGNLVFVPQDGGLVLDSDVALDFGSQQELLDLAPALSVAFDLRDGTGAPLHRIRAQGATPAHGGAGNDILIGGRGNDLQVITFTGLELLSSDADAVRALFAAEYADYDSSMFGRAQSLLQPVADLLATDPEAAVLYWHGGTSPTGETIEPAAPQILGVLVDLLVDTVDREAMACSVGLPFVVEAGQAMDAPFELAAIVEEAATIGDIMNGFREELAGGGGDDVVFGGLGQDDLVNRPAVTCDAVIAMASALADGPVEGLPPAKRDALMELGFSIDSSRAAYLTRLVIELEAHMAGNPEMGEVLGSDWLTAAKTKADILIESLGNAAQAADDTHTVQTEILALD